MPRRALATSSSDRSRLAVKRCRLPCPAGVGATDDGFPGEPVTEELELTTHGVARREEVAIAEKEDSVVRKRRGVRALDHCAAEAHGYGIRLDRTSRDLEQGRLSRAVAPHQRRPPSRDGA